MNKQTEKEKAQETQIDAETHTFAHTDILQNTNIESIAYMQRAYMGDLSKCYEIKNPPKILATLCCVEHLLLGMWPGLRFACPGRLC